MTISNVNRERGKAGGRESVTEKGTSGQSLLPFFPFLFYFSLISSLSSLSQPFLPPSLSPSFSLIFSPLLAALRPGLYGQESSSSQVPVLW